jgi:hypothetical protein
MTERPVRFARVVGFGLLAEVATALAILVVLQMHARLFGGGVDAAISGFAQRAPLILGPGLGVLFTFIAALRAARPVPGRGRLHGLLVGVVASVLTIPGMVATPALAPIYAGAILLKLAAGWAAGAQIEWKRSSA